LDLCLVVLNKQKDKLCTLSSSEVGRLGAGEIFGSMSSWRRSKEN
jgi:hypothetical protein